jgi:putative transcriptional regulator
MTIILRLDRMMADRKISLNEPANKVGIANVNLSNIKTGKVSTIRLSTLDAICDVLDCQAEIFSNFIKKGVKGL